MTGSSSLSLAADVDVILSASLSLLVGDVIMSAPLSLAVEDTILSLSLSLAVDGMTMSSPPPLALDGMRGWRSPSPATVDGIIMSFSLSPSRSSVPVVTAPAA